MYGTTSRFQTPDGGLITLAADGYDLDDPWSAQVRLTARDPARLLPTGHQVRGFDIEFAGNYDYVIAEVLHGTVTDRLDSRGGQLLLARGDQQALALWRGPFHEAAIWLSDPRTPTAHALRYFDGITFTDSAAGLVVESQTPDVEEVETIEVIKRVPGVGYLDVKNAAAAFELVPTWAGAKASAGEIWRQIDDDLPVFILANTTTVTVLSGEGKQKSTEGPRLEFLDRLTTLSWTER
ncbi:hypothetical protein [Actinophytocola sp.]|uniref:hypothetical protein n=1 Tax=Actinophytocola sp. TaxID=1872138 RepID=UPI003D6A53A2